MRRFCLFFASIFFFGLAAGQGAAPQINAPYRSPDYEQWRQRFETEGREVYDQRRAIVAAARARPGMAVADFERIPGVSPDWILKHVRAGKEAFRAEIEAAGFRFVEEVKLMRENYFLRFARD